MNATLYNLRTNPLSFLSQQDADKKILAADASDLYNFRKRLLSRDNSFMSGLEKVET